MSTALADLVRRSPQRLRADRSRVVAQLFVPGQEGFDHQDSRTGAVLRRILALGDDEAAEALDSVVARFGDRHRDLAAVFRLHATAVGDRLDPAGELSDTRRLLMGAAFTSEYAIEGAALCNPSIVADPDQSGVAAGELRIVMSVRAVGEGHRSSIGFRSGKVGADGRVHIAPASGFATTGTAEVGIVDAAMLRGQIDHLKGAGENADFVLDGLGERFTTSDLEARLGLLQRQAATRRHGGETVALMRAAVQRTYTIRFAEDVPLGERVLRPSMAAESHGMEDARFVRFVDDDGGISYHASYTAFDGADISQQLLTTTDFRSFTSSPLVGAATANKGLALFPRRIRGRFAALVRSDRESNMVAFSPTLQDWRTADAFQVPTRAWEAIQVGNCGSPMETEAGWLVLTHGVGPMRTYSIGAVLLDLDDPRRVLGALPEPLLTPAADEQDGYVPNVVYSCGALVHAGTVILPYGIGDAAIGVATVPVSTVLDALVPASTA